jgi:hypothetical protein
MKYPALFCLIAFMPLAPPAHAEGMFMNCPRTETTYTTKCKEVAKPLGSSTCAITLTGEDPSADFGGTSKCNPDDFSQTVCERVEVVATIPCQETGGDGGDGGVGDSPGT